MNRILRRGWLIAGLLFLLLSSTAAARPPEADQDFNYNRARLLSYLLREHLPRHHFSHKAIDDELSRAAFGLYLKQLDSQKRFLLKDDVRELEAFASRIDDELQQGRNLLPVLAAEIMERRIAAVEKLVTGLLATKLDLESEGSFETDAEKLDFCTDEAELRERWRRALTYQVIVRYLNLVDDRAAEAKQAGEEPVGTGGVDPGLAAEAREKVAKSYADFFTRLKQDTQQDYYDRYFSSIARAYDPHTDYLPPNMKEDFDIGMRGSLEGIGATLREEDGYIKVVAVIPGSAAYRQGQLQAEDVILKVAEADGEPVDITDMRLRDAVGLIRGPKGTEVRLTVRQPDGDLLVVPIVRDVVQIEETFVKGAVIADPEARETFGYIKIPSFYRDFQGAAHGGKVRNVTDDVRAELQRLKREKVAGIVLDLRNDGGGALTDAVSIAGLFIRTGPVVQVKSSDGTLETLNDDDPDVEYDGPLVVLVNKFSASASEILAGMLQDYRRALVVGGEHTHGKGTVQALIDLDRSLALGNMERYRPLGALKVTVQKFYRVTGESTQYRGVTPDIVLPDRLKHLKTGEQYADYSLPWDTVRPVTFASWGRNGERLESIRSRSQERVAESEEFADLVREAAEVKERNERTRQALNLAEVRRERAEAESLAAEAPHGEMKASDRERGELTAAEKEAALAEDVLEDPVAREGLAVLDDLAANWTLPLSARTDMEAASRRATARQP